VVEQNSITKNASYQVIYKNNQMLIVSSSAQPCNVCLHL